MNQITQCRICSGRLERVLDLGEQALTGVFPREKNAPITRGPIRLVKCVGGCGLLQLEHSYDLNEMYGVNYGYRSGLNLSMVNHLRRKVERIMEAVRLVAGDVVVDIGSNDGTTLAAYPKELVRVGIDPTAMKFKEFYPEGAFIIPQFFTPERLRIFPRKPKVITSFSMFYDLEDPMQFMREIYNALDDNGIWVVEQSYMPAMLAATSYDTVCHEHLEFYAMRQITWMADRVGFTIRDVEFNDVNGGSFSITMAKDGGESSAVQDILWRETELGLETMAPYEQFAARAAASSCNLVTFVRGVRAAGKTVAALGASTKGNVLLQYCGFTEEDISYIGEVNPDKFGAFTPGTNIPIISETELFERRPDYVLVLPWHFKKFFVESPKYANLNLIFPLEL